MSGIISNCNSSRCVFCKRGSLDKCTDFYSICTNSKYSVNINTSCQTKCCIYLITCKKCHIKYVGLTKGTLRYRFNYHRGHILAGTEAEAMKLHFTSNNGCNIPDMTAKPIEICTTANLEERESFWIHELNTIYPYGLNMDPKKKGFRNVYTSVNDNTSELNIYSFFNFKNSQRSKRGQGNMEELPQIQLNHLEFSASLWIQDVTTSISSSANVVHSLRTEIFKLKLCKIKELYLHSVNQINCNSISNECHKHFMLLIKDLCLYKIKQNYKEVKSKRSFLVVNFTNKLVERVHLNRILQFDDIKGLFPVKGIKYSSPTISYTRDNNIRSKVLNYHQTIKDSIHTSYVCNCASYSNKYLDVHHNHIITGDLSIIDNVKLRNLLIKGLSFHEQQPPNVEKAYNSIKGGIDSYIDQISKKFSIHAAQFSAWKCEILRKVNDKLHSSKKFKFNNVLSKEHPKQCLKRLQEDFVFVQIDKAGNNIALVCKSYYMDILNSEVLNSGTFVAVNDNELDVVKTLSNSQFIKNHNQRLSSFYCIPKMHKTPVKFRFITAGKNTILQNLSICLGKCLKKLVHSATTYEQYKIKEIDNSIFIIDNRDRVIKFINKENISTSQGKKFNTSWDFATLYTKIPHNQLKNNVSKFVHKVFTMIKDKRFICVNAKSKYAYYSVKSSPSNLSFTRDTLINALRFLIDNSFICFQNNVYKQVVGIPMGTNCAPYLANIYLHVFEYKYLTTLVRNDNIEIAKKLSNMFRYQDDCLLINDNGLFSEHYGHMYPREMILECTNISRDKCTFLDLTISVYKGKFLYKSYDKRNNFGFDIVSYPNITGNVPAAPSYGVYVSQLVRFCDINQSYKHFIADVKVMSAKFISQSFELPILRRKYQDFCRKYFYKWSKYNHDITKDCEKIFPR